MAKFTAKQPGRYISYSVDFISTSARWLWSARCGNKFHCKQLLSNTLPNMMQEECMVKPIVLVNVGRQS